MLNCNFSGKYIVYKYKKNEQAQKVGEFKNLITDWGLKYQALNNIPENICIGSSATTPSIADDDLKGFLYQQNATATRGQYFTEEEEEWYKYSIFTTEFAPKGVSYIVREVGFGRVDKQGIYSRSLTKDLDGNPTDIVVLEDEYLKVTYELRMYFKTKPTIITFVPTGDDTVVRTAKCVHECYTAGSTYYQYHSNYSILPRAFTIYKDAQDIGSINSANPQGGTQVLISSASASVNPTGFGGKTKISLTTSQAIGNLNYIYFFYSISVGTIGNKYQSCKIFFDPPFIKTNEDVFEFTLELTWGRK